MYFYSKDQSDEYTEAEIERLIRVERYEAKFEENLAKPELISESFAEADDNILLDLAARRKTTNEGSQSIIYEHMHKVTECQLKFDRRGEEL